jgi:hypothetical protein
VDLPLGEIGSVTAKLNRLWTKQGGVLSRLVTFRVAGGKAKTTFTLRSEEVPHFARALEILLRDRFVQPPAKGSDGVRYPTIDRRRPRRRGPLGVRRPFRSRPLGFVLQILALATFALGIVAIDQHERLVELARTTGWIPQQLLDLWAHSVELGRGPAEFWLCIAVGIAGWGLGARLRLRDMNQALAGDGRPHFLYLRSFSSDRLPGPDRRQFADNNILGLIRFFRGLSHMTFEQEFARFFRKRGQLVAIGKPGEWLGRPGAARVYVGDEVWQATVIDLMTRAQAVVLRLEPTEGTWWEFLACIERVQPTKLLILLSHANRSQQRYEELRLLIEASTAIRLPRGIGDALFLYFDEGWRPRLLRLDYIPKVFWPFADSILDLKRSLRPFLDHLAPTVGGTGK